MHGVRRANHLPSLGREMSDVWYQVIMMEIDDVAPRRRSTLPNL